MNEQKTLTLEELKAEQSKIAGLIKIAREARIVALRKELDELLNDHTSTVRANDTRAKGRPIHSDPSVPRRLYTMKEAAQSLGMSSVSVRRLVDRGLLKPNRALGKLLFPATELDRFASEK
jgi:hypothetical protein